MKLKVLAFGYSIGIVWAAIILFATALAMVRGGGHHLQLLGTYFIGYKLSWLGCVIGIGWGLLSGFIIGAAIAIIYNARVPEKTN